MSYHQHIQYGPSLHKPLTVDSLGQQIYNSLIINSKKNLDAFIDGYTGEKISYRDVLFITTRLADALKNAGYKKDDIITVCSENSVFFYLPVFAACYLSIIVAPVNNSYKEGELLHTLNISKPKIIFCSKGVLQNFIDIKNQCNFIERIIVMDFSNDTNSLKSFMDQYTAKNFDPHYFEPLAVNSKEQSAAILCSSGTTGLPKGVVLTNENINVRINQASDTKYDKFGIDEHMFMLGMLPFFHGYGFITITTNVIFGNSIIVLSRFEEKVFYKNIEKYKIPYLMIVPPIALLLAKSPVVDSYDLSCIQEIICGAAPLGEDTEHLLKQRLPNIKVIRQAYGLTEATLAVLHAPLKAVKSGSSGKVVPDMSMIIRDHESGKILGPNIVGEICVKGRMVMKGYYNNPEDTNKSFTDDGWLLTGDLGYMDSEGYFFIVDRLKELIKYKGFQVAPAELEAVLNSHPKVRDAAVIGLPDAACGELPMAFVVKNGNVTEHEIKKFVADRVSAAKQLRGGVKFLESIPKNPSGKILRRELRKLIGHKLKSQL